MILEVKTRLAYQMVVNDNNYWKTGNVYNNDCSHNSYHNQDHVNNNEDHYGVHSESIESIPYKIPNDGEKIVLRSSVSRVVKIQLEDHQIVKNKVVRYDNLSGRLF